MTQSNLLELARQGDPQAIAALMNRSLQPRGLTASVGLQDSRLHVLLESAQVPNREALTTFVRNGIHNLGLKSVRTIEILAHQTGADSPAWSERIDLETTSVGEPGTNAVLNPASVPPSQPAQIKRPAPPPPPPMPLRRAAEPSAAAQPEPVPTETPEVSGPLVGPDITPPPVEGNSALEQDTTPGIPVESTDRSTFAQAAPVEGEDLEDSAVRHYPDAAIDATVAGATPVVPSPEISVSQPLGEEVSTEPSLEANADQRFEPLLEPDSLPVLDSRSEPGNVNTQSNGFVSEPSTHEYVVDEPDGERAEPAEADLAVVPVADGAESPRRKALPRSLKPILGGLILLLVVGWLGLIGYMVWRNTSTNVAPPPEPSPPAENPADAEQSADPSPSPQLPALPDNPLEEASNRATQAETLSQTAQSTDDWNLVAAQWEQAIALVSSIPADSPNYTLAQQRLTSYQQQLNATRQRIANLPAVTNPLPPSSTVVVSDGISCPQVASTGDSASVELTSVQFAPDPDAEGGDFVIGCVTNHSEQTIAGINVSYRGGSTDNPNLFDGGFSSLGISNLEPGKTVPFRSSFTINPEVTSIQIEAIFWTPEGASEPQRLETNLTLDRQV